MDKYLVLFYKYLEWNISEMINNEILDRLLQWVRWLCASVVDVSVLETTSTKSDISVMSRREVRTERVDYPLPPPSKCAKVSGYYD